MKICVGGTFNYLHKGHKLLLKKAFESAGKNGEVFIGLSAGNLVRNKKSTKTFETRKKNLEKYLIELGYKNNSTIVPINSKFGLTLVEDFDAIIISPETEKIAIQINKERISKNKKQLKIIKVPFVLAEDGKPISSTRINNKEIDENGHLI
jgi:pantetheine-phosphate adenylyltransferase